ncbi:septum formation inhibitor Maf [Cryomorpha ignava]|uniref:Septum formation inhibitor Maf n=1 Tax=Cryomorpha ignava TaxID=101383 RepID=A0A7K3WLT4_9FLAO|nr:septum formation inhibitor Maf [Cryomorpha ignava]NEN22468.1 septum formation inhibitor Maf [Cryomorpha ignava]
MPQDIKKITFYIILLFTFSSCDAQVNTSPDDSFEQTHPEQFGDYWYAGKAELNHFDLTQIRYGEKRKGDAVLIYVTEDFLPEKQVKKEFGDEKGISVLKLNYMKKFITGIYDYSIMTSIFTPIEFRKYPQTLKLTFSSQDWCGQSFAQMNLRNGKLNYEQRSYFQAEGDVNEAIDATYVEEDVWTRIRLEPQMLPLGKIKMVPSQEYLRLNHKDLKAYDAQASLVLQVNDVKSEEPKEFYVYTIKYPELDRVLKISCQSLFPFKIISWEETNNFSNPAKALTTKAEARNTEMLPYWELNKNANQSLRDSLGLHYKITE